MARVMSLAFMAFLIVPVAAPTIGQLVLVVAPWHWIFYLLGGFAIFVGIWAWLRLPETLPIDRRRSINPRSIGRAVAETLTNRYSLGYTISSGLIFGGLIGFLNSSQQIFEHSFHAPQYFAVGFALIAGGMAVAALVNSRIVERLGMRMVSHGALLGMILLSLLRIPGA
jgi:DHA1 family bicyclomycin/chloramphenicol resistance-like MFS transporter